MLRKPWFKVVMNQVIETPTVELFADRDLHLFPQWMGPGAYKPHHEMRLGFIGVHRILVFFLGESAIQPTPRSG